MSIKDELLKIKGDGEFLIAEEAVAWAKRNPNSDLHRSLEWDDKKAADEYRLHQVRRLVQIHLVYENDVRSFVSLTIDRSREGGGYRAVDDVLASETLHQIMLEDALRELQRVQTRYDQIQQLRPVWRAAAKARKAYKSRQSRGRRKGGGAQPSAA